MRVRLLSGLVALVPALCLLACSQASPRPPSPSAKSPEKKSPEGKSPERKSPERKKPVVLATEDVDRRVGEEEAKKVGGAMGIVERPELASFVSRVGKRVAEHAPNRRFDYQFKIVDDDAPNAFALPGGFIYISRGLLVLANSEDELANVLGHEVVHAAARHAAGRQAVEQHLGFLSMFALGHVASYGRDQEREADRVGQQMAAAAGYDPDALATFLRDLEFTERLRLGGSRLPGFFDTHPATTERVATAGARARNIRWTPQPGILADRGAYLRLIQGLPIGTAASEGVFQGDRFLHADLGFMMRFPDGWKTINTRQAVGAISPRRDAQVYLEHQSLGDDPEHAAAEFLEESAAEGMHVKLESTQPLELNGFPAYRATGRVSTPAGGGGVTLTWIAKDGHIYRITGASNGPGTDKYRGAFLSVARSFRSLPPAAEKTIHEERLAIAKAREGESLKQLSTRTGNRWDLQTTAVMNDVFANATFEEGQLVKVALAMRYRP